MYAGVLVLLFNVSVFWSVHLWTGNGKTCTIVFFQPLACLYCMCVYMCECMRVYVCVRKKEIKREMTRSVEFVQASLGGVTLIGNRLIFRGVL